MSDHVAFKSDGDLAIILDSHDDEHFIVHAVSSGELSVVNYRELKEIIRVFRLLPATIYVANIPERKIKQPLPPPSDTLTCKPENIGGKMVAIKTSKNCKVKALQVLERDCFILGVPINKLKSGFVEHVATQIAAKIK